MTAIGAWLGALGVDDTTTPGRRLLQEGDRLRMAGRVMSLRAAAGLIEGRIQGSHARPHLVELRVAQWTADQWREVSDLLARQARHYARLLAGQLPDQFDVALTELGLSLLPQPDGWHLRCSCGVAPPCSHQVALWLATRARLDTDPYLLTRVRGRSREQLLAEIRDRRSDERRDSVALTALDTAGWSRGRVHPSEVPLPPVNRPLAVAGPLRMLGDPVGWAGPTSALAMFGPAVAAAGACARALLAADDE